MCIDRPPHPLLGLHLIPTPFNRSWTAEVDRGTLERRKNHHEGREETGTVDPTQQYNLKKEKGSWALEPICLSPLKKSFHLYNTASG